MTFQNIRLALLSNELLPPQGFNQCNQCKPDQVFPMPHSNEEHRLMGKLLGQYLALLQAITARLKLLTSFKLIVFGLQWLYPCMYIMHPAESPLPLVSLFYKRCFCAPCPWLHNRNWGLWHVCSLTLLNSSCAWLWLQMFMISKQVAAAWSARV